MLKYAVVGTGWIVKSFIEGAERVEQLKYYGVYSRSEERGREFARETGAERVFTDLDELAASDTDCVYIASPNALHYEHSRRMLEAGKHVICEKPLTVNESEASELFALAESRGLVFMEAIMYMHAPARAVLKGALSQIGGITGAHFDFTQLSSKYPAYKRGELPNIFNPALATGSLMDLGVYCVYPALDLLGEAKNIVAASHFLESGADAQTTVFCECGGVPVTITCSKTAQDYLGSQIFGELGTVSIESISKLTGMRLHMHSGGSRLLCGDTPKAELMGNEAEAFYHFITAPERFSQLYDEARKMSASVSRTMEEIRGKAGIRFGLK